jgi:hypothetical protein
MAMEPGFNRHGSGEGHLAGYPYSLRQDSCTKEPGKMISSFIELLNVISDQRRNLISSIMKTPNLLRIK